MGSTSKLLAGVAAAALLCGSVVLGDNPVAGDDIGYDLPNVIANLEVHSARHSRVEDFAESLAALSTDGYTLLIEDNAVAVYFNEENASIRVMDKKSGYVWGCLEPGAEANKTWSSVGNGILAVDLVDSKLVAKKQGLGYPGETSFDYKVSGKTAAFTARFTKYGVTIPFTMSLVDGNLKFEMDTTKIEETGKYLVQNVYFVPFLGSTKEDEVPGYFFLPDGSGALMRFQKSSSYTVVYNERIYGKDYAIDQTAQTNDLKSSRPNDFLTDANNVTLPVFGGVQGVKQHGFVAEVTGGAEFAAIMATRPVMTTKYNCHLPLYRPPELYAADVEKRFGRPDHQKAAQRLYGLHRVPFPGWRRRRLYRNGQVVPQPSAGTGNPEPKKRTTPAAEPDAIGPG